MKQPWRGGFTIIEVMLFLGVSGLMLAGVMAGAQANLQAQHYRDGVDELRNLIQGQFDKVYNLTNNRTGADPCGGSSQHRGTSDCLYVGRMLQFEVATDGASRLSIWPVVARQKNASLDPASHSAQSSQRSASIGGLQSYEIKVFNADSSLRQTHNLSWGIKAYAPDSSPHSPNLASALLVLRSPVDGTVRSYKFSQRSSIYTASGLPRDLTQSGLTDIAAGASTKTIACLAPGPGMLWPGSAMAVVVAGLATGPGDVESLSGDELRQREGRTCRKN